MITRTLVIRMFHVKIGMRNIVMPGARMQTMVVMKLTAPRIVPKPPSASPKMTRSAPSPGSYVWFDNGVYMNQPKAAGPLGVRKPAEAMRPPNR